MRAGKSALALAVLAFGTAGCSVIPDQVSGCVSHVSHPLRGWPTGPNSEEDSLDTVGACARWERGRVYIEQGLGYRYVDGGFYGDDFVYSGQFGVKLWEKKR